MIEMPLKKLVTTQKSNPDFTATSVEKSLHFSNYTSAGLRSLAGKAIYELITIPRRPNWWKMGVSAKPCHILPNIGSWVVFSFWSRMFPFVKVALRQTFICTDGFNRHRKVVGLLSINRYRAGEDPRLRSPIFFNGFEIIISLYPS